ncbi:hypothetical protein BDZ97DRAFT_1924131 [Flammula alnicola]|nr:hypothetical protein BDZ97DRAFT_1924131 [Flammula alnicola]
MPLWPPSIYCGPPHKADILLGTTCFSSADLDNLSDFDTESNMDTDHDVGSRHSLFDLANHTNMTKKDIKNSEIQAEITRRKALSDRALDTVARYNHPTFPASSFLTTLLQPDRFKNYIANEFPSIILENQTPPVTSTNQESLRKEVNATVANSLLNSRVPSNITTLVSFPTISFLCHSTINALITTEKTVQDWLNHLAHTLGVKHGLIQKKKPEEPMSTSEDNGQVDGGPGGNLSAEIGDASGADVGVEEDNLDNGVEKVGFITTNAQDRSFSMLSYRKGPSGAYRLRTPDLILVN